MHSEKIIRMANQIAAFMRSKPREQALEGLAAHISDYWEPRMRRQLFEIVAVGESALDPLVVAAAPRIRRPAEG
jgi:formate dehydrogenase subunit delta